MQCKLQYTLTIGLFITALLMACNSSQPLSQQSKTEDYSGMATLADALRTKSGVQVMGTSNNIKVTIRGVNSTRTSSTTTYTQSATNARPQARQTTEIKDVEPLFIIDNTIVGNSYASAAQGVNIQDVVSIQVLKSYAETNSYGESGKNGVIKITTKLGADH